jgi:hypothetical protein
MTGGKRLHLVNAGTIVIGQVSIEGSHRQEHFHAVRKNGVAEETYSWHWGVCRKFDARERSVYRRIEPGMNFFDRKGIRIKKNVFLIGCWRYPSPLIVGVRSIQREKRREDRDSLTHDISVEYTHPTGLPETTNPADANHPLSCQLIGLSIRLQSLFGFYPSQTTFRIPRKRPARIMRGITSTDAANSSLLKPESMRPIYLSHPHGESISSR